MLIEKLFTKTVIKNDRNSSGFINDSQFRNQGAPNTRISFRMFEGKREAERQYNEGVRYQCLKSKAELEKNIDGSLSIRALIME